MKIECVELCTVYHDNLHQWMCRLDEYVILHILYKPKTVEEV